MIDMTGLTGKYDFTLELTPEDWDFVNDVNARGMFFALQAGARQMMRQAPMSEGRPRGKIINIASIAGRSGRPMFAAYAASKAAAISITQSAAVGLAPDITVNAVCPGVVDTEMWRLVDREWTQAEQRPVGSAWQDRIRGIPMGRPETREDPAGTAASRQGRCRLQHRPGRPTRVAVAMAEGPPRLGLILTRPILQGWDSRSGGTRRDSPEPPSTDRRRRLRRTSTPRDSRPPRPRRNASGAWSGES